MYHLPGILRRFSRSLLIAAGIIILLILYFFVVDPALWQWRARRDLIQRLSAAATPEELLKATGKLGIFIPVKNGSWIAICYRDTHANHLSSLAIAKDSGGGWYECGYHFCAEFSGYKHEQERLKEQRAEAVRSGKPQPEMDPEREDSDDYLALNVTALDAIFAASNLEEARRKLPALGFKPLKQ